VVRNFQNGGGKNADNKCGEEYSEVADSALTKDGLDFIPLCVETAGRG
jgi:hypothetical protein